MRSVLVAVVALGVLAGFSAGTRAKPADYTLAGTRSCLLRLPHAIAGLPPAAPLGRPAVFVYRLSYRSQDSEFVLGGGRPHTQLGAWSSAKYHGIIFSFFRTASAARLSFKGMAQLFGGVRIGNVVATWDGAKPRRLVRRTFLGCLRSGRPSSIAATGPVPAASLRTFAGTWGGHTRGVSISMSGVGQESASDGCCTRLYHLSFQITSVSGTLTRARAVYRVTAFTNYANGGGITINVGDIGKLRLRNGILANTLSHDYFCSGVAWGASRTGGCGA